MAFQACAVLSGLIVGWTRRGSVWAIPKVQLKALWILPMAYLLQHISIFYLHGLIYEITVVLSYCALIGFCLLNIRIPGLPWAAGGTTLNFLEMLVNGLRMPAYVPAVQHVAPHYVPLLLSGHYGKSVAMSTSTHLNFLGDIFSFEVQPVSLISIGDILFAIGLVVLIQHAMLAEKGVAGDGCKSESWPIT